MGDEALVQIADGGVQRADLPHQVPGRVEQRRLKDLFALRVLLKIAFPEQKEFPDRRKGALLFELDDLLLDLCLQVLEHVLHAEQEQLVLVGIVVIHHPLGDSVPCAEILHGDLVVAMGAEFLHGCLKDLTPAALLALLLLHSGMSSFPPCAVRRPTQSPSWP